MANREYRETRRAFINGDVNRLRLGGYGGTINVLVVADGVMISTTKPTRRQKKLTPNSRATREAAVMAAEAALDRIHSVPARRDVKIPPRVPTRVGLITPRDVWISYLRLRVGAIPEDEVLGWSREDVAAFLKLLPPSARRAALSSSYIYSVVQAARRLHDDGVVPLDGDLEDIQPGDLDAWAISMLTAGASPHTVRTYMARFQNVIRTYKSKWPHEWGDRIDPTCGVNRISTGHIRPPEIGEERAARIMARLRFRGAWRALATALIADATARRVASISGGRVDLHLDAAPLCAADFRQSADGTLEVVWRADAQKGHGFGRGDVAHPASRQLELVYRWLIRFHPNPLGPEFPLIWAEEDPSRPESYDRLSRELEEAWLEEFGEEKPRGLGWHAFCRTTITTLADGVGMLTAAEFTGRSVRMIERTYKRARRETARDAAQHLDKVRRGRRIRLERPSDSEARHG